MMNGVVLQWSFWTLTILFGIVAISANLIAFIVFVKEKTLKKKQMNVFLASLAMADILMVPFVAPGYAKFACIHGNPLVSCKVFVGMKDFVFLASNLNVLAVLYDRYCAVLRPLRYPVIMRNDNVKRLLKVIWVSPAIVTSIRLVWYLNPSLDNTRIGKIYDNVLLFAFVLLPISVMTGVNFRIAIAIQRQRRELLKSSVLSLTSLEDKSNPKNSQASIKRRTELLQARKGTLTCLRVVLVYIVAWIPRIAFNLFFLFGKQDDPVLMKISLLFLFFQSLLNPFIYSYYRSDFRCAVRRMFCKT